MFESMPLYVPNTVQRAVDIDNGTQCLKDLREIVAPVVLQYPEQVVRDEERYVTEKERFVDKFFRLDNFLETVTLANGLVSEARQMPHVHIGVRKDAAFSSFWFGFSRAFLFRLLSSNFFAVTNVWIPIQKNLGKYGRCVPSGGSNCYFNTLEWL